MNAVIYARFSDGPNQTEQSIEGQVADCKAYAKANNINIVGVYADHHISGRSTEHRYEFLRMVKDAEAGKFDAVITWKVDRFGRDRYDIAVNKNRLKRAGVKLLYSTLQIPDAPEGILLESMMEGYAEYYSAELRQKVIRGRRETLKKGMSPGSALPYGYVKDKDRHIVPDPEKAAIVVGLFKMYAHGSKLQACVDYMNANGATSIRGDKMSRSVVHRALRNRRYLGIFDESGIELRVPPIIDEQLFEEVQLMHRTSRNNAAGKAQDDYLLSCKCYCAYHENVLLIGESGRGRNGTVYNYYKCGVRKRGGDCDLKPIPRDLLEDLVINATVEDMLTDDVIDMLADEVIRIQSEETADSMLEILRGKLASTKKRSANLLAAIETGAAPASVLIRLQELESEAAELEKEIVKEEIMHPTVERGAVVSWLKSFRAGNKKDAAFRRRLVDTFIARVDVDNENAVIYYNMTEKNSPNPVRIRTIKWRLWNGIRTPMVYDGFLVLRVRLPWAS